MLRKPKILFLSTGDSTRSQIAQGFLCRLSKSQFTVLSVGIKPSWGPLANELMREVGIDISRQKSKSVAQALKESFAYVVTISDPAKERTPIFPFTLHLLHWSIVDPTEIDAASPVRMEVFRRVRDQIESKVQSFIDEAVHAQQDKGVLVYA